MGSAHPVDTDFCEDLEGGVSMAHDGLANVVQAMVTMERDFVDWHRGDLFRVVCEAEEVLRNGVSSVLCVIDGLYSWNLRGNGAGGTWRLRIRLNQGRSGQGATEEDSR